MQTAHETNRRNFLKQSAAGAAAIVTSGAFPSKVFAKDSAWSNRQAINPEIDNLRVVCCHDTDMVSATPSNWDMDSQNAVVVKDKVQANMDGMAMALAQKSNAAEAWATIFQKPSGKNWSEVKVAIKVNGIEPKLMTKFAIIDKLCRELNRRGEVDGVEGVQYSNIIIYDGCHNAWGKYNGYEGSEFPDVQVSDGNSLLGGMIPTAVPAPYSGTADCTAHIANGTIDILINCAVNKNHGDGVGGCTLTMKNHYGTFDPQPNGGSHASPQMDYLIGINKSDAILGGTPPRQQLCIVDSLFAMSGGPTGNITDRLDRIVMGVFGPAVDYLVVKKLRIEVMGKNYNATALDNQARFLTDFGYEENELTDFVSVDPTAVYPEGVSQPSRTYSVLFDSAPSNTQAAFTVPVLSRLYAVTILTTDGRIVRKLNACSVFQQQPRIFWDGRDCAGKTVGQGNFVACLSGSGFKQSRVIKVVR